MSDITRGKIIRDDVAWYDGVTRTASRLDATGGTVSGLAFGVEVDVLQVFGSGTDFTLSTVNDMIARVGSNAATVVFAPGTWAITDDVTVPANIASRIPAGAVFDVSAGKTLTFSGPVYKHASTWTSGSGTVSADLSEQIILYARSANEKTESVVPSNYTYPVGDVRRYGAVLDGTTDDSTALQNAINVCKGTGVIVRIEGGDLRIDSQITVEETSGTRCYCNFYQDRDSTILSYVTGSIAGFATAGFAIRFDGWTESVWDNLSLNYDNGTAGIVSRVQFAESISCTFNSARIVGGSVVGDRETTTKVSVRYIGNEAASGDVAYANYFDKWVAPYFNIGNILIDMVVGDGDASTNQPNALILVAPQFQRYITAFNMNDTDEHLVKGGWHHAAPGITHGTNPTITQTGGTATVTHTSHGYATGDILLISGANEGGYNINGAKITVNNANEYTYTVDSGTASPATGTITAKLTTVGYRGETTLSKIEANMEPGVDTIPFYLDDGGSGSNMLLLMNNTGLAGVFEDKTEENLLLDRYFYESPLRHRFRVNNADVANFYSAYTVLEQPVAVPAAAWSKATIASATNITYTRSQVWRLTGTTTINTITDPDGVENLAADELPEVIIIFGGSITVNDKSTSAGNINLSGSAAQAFSADDTLHLVWNDFANEWHEVSRSLNG